MMKKAETGLISRDATWLEAYARRLFLSFGKHIAHGQIVLQDGDQQDIFGTVSEKYPLSSTIRVFDPAFYLDFLLGGDMGLAESYIRGRWTADDMQSLLRIAYYNNSLYNKPAQGFGFMLKPFKNFAHWLRKNTEAGSLRNIMAHYDLGNDFFSLFLDETMAYSCAYFESENCSLADASRAKFERLCRRLCLKPSDHLLEIGSGWGGFAIYAASRYGCKVTTTTISKEQRQWVVDKVKAAGLEDKIEVLDQDYRKLEGQYDKLVSIEMIEAVGHHFLGVFFEKCSQLLKDNGLMALQAITVPNRFFHKHKTRATFINKYIFPGSCLPSDEAMLRCITDKTDLELVFKEDISPHYARTLAAWRLKFMEQIDQIRKFWPNDEFIRTWELYFQSCEAGFTERNVSVAQYLFSKPNARPIL